MRRVASTTEPRTPFFVVRLFSSQFIPNLNCETLVKLFFNWNTPKFIIFQEPLGLLIGLEIHNVGSKELLTRFHMNYTPASGIQIDLIPFKGINKGCLELDKSDGVYLFSWGISFEEFKSRAKAGETKTNVDTATLLLVKYNVSPMESQNRRFYFKCFVLERLLSLMHDLGFPPHYLRKGELDYPEYATIHWLMYHLLYRREGDSGPHLCIIGATEYAKRFIVDTIGSYFDLYLTSPLMEGFVGASNADVWLVEGCSSLLFTKRWALSEAGLKFEKLLRGEPVTFQWGTKGEFSYNHRGAVPIILLCEENHIPVGLYHYSYSMLLVMVNFRANWNTVLHYDRIIACFFRLGLNHLENYRRERYKDPSSEYFFVRMPPNLHFVWSTCDLDVISDLSFFFYPEEIDFFTKRKKELPGSLSVQVPHFVFGPTPLSYILGVQYLRIRWLRAYLNA